MYKCQQCTHYKLSSDAVDCTPFCECHNFISLVEYGMSCANYEAITKLNTGV